MPAIKFLINESLINSSVKISRRNKKQKIMKQKPVATSETTNYIYIFCSENMKIHHTKTGSNAQNVTTGAMRIAPISSESIIITFVTSGHERNLQLNRYDTYSIISALKKRTGFR